ncbi:MAG: glycosyltransferase [Pseudonocardia sp.]|nr:glycosyltransferase [Pseudonocardia sp.]
MLTDVLVRHNRWDLLAAYPVPVPRVSVVVCHYDQPDQLARTWAALCAQTLPPLEVIVSDDGSPEPPPVPAGGPPVRVVRQPDLGFRAAAARNLGARHATGEVLVFLDADTVPEPGFLAAVTAHVAVCPDVLAVGRRRHADLRGTEPGADPAGAPRLPEPSWLAEEYRRTRNLLDADGRSFRFVISAVLACRRSLFADLGGFDERFVGYGGEDWDLAYRAWNGGAVLVHEPGAVAWHDGPDWAGRATERERKDLESMRLAALVPEPATRGVPLPGALPDVLVDLGDEVTGSVPDTVRVVHSLLGQTHRDLRVRVVDPDPAVAELYGGAVRSVPWTADQRRRARARLTVHRALPPDAVSTLLGELVGRDLATVRALGPDGRVAATMTSTRALGRARRWPGAAVLDEAFGHAAVDVTGVRPTADLAGWFARASAAGDRGSPAR